jgi:hypothetical protein
MTKRPTKKTNGQGPAQLSDPGRLEPGLRFLSDEIIKSTAEAWRGDGVGVDRHHFEHGLALIAARQSPSQFPLFGHWSTWFMLQKRMSEKLAALRGSAA